MVEIIKVLREHLVMFYKHCAKCLYSQFLWSLFSRIRTEYCLLFTMKDVHYLDISNFLNHFSGKSFTFFIYDKAGSKSVLSELLLRICSFALSLFVLSFPGLTTAKVKLRLEMTGFRILFIAVYRMHLFNKWNCNRRS